MPMQLTKKDYTKALYKSSCTFWKTWIVEKFNDGMHKSFMTLSKKSTNFTINALHYSSSSEFITVLKSSEYIADNPCSLSRASPNNHKDKVQ